MFIPTAGLCFCLASVVALIFQFAADMMLIFDLADIWMCMHKFGTQYSYPFFTGSFCNFVFQAVPLTVFFQNLFQVFHSQSQHIAIRMSCINYLRKNREKFEAVNKPFCIKDGHRGPGCFLPCCFAGVIGLCFHLFPG